MPYSRPQGVVAGIALVVASGAILASMDTMAKLLSSHLPVVEIVWARYFFHTILMTLYLLGRSGTAFLRTKRPALQILRGSMLATGTGLMYVALSKVPLADATAVQFFSPVLVTILSVVFLGEKIGIPRIAAVAVGFLGVLLVTRPGLSTTSPYIFLPLGAACVFSVYFLLTRELSGREEAASTLFNTTAIGALLLSLVVPFVWQVPTASQLAMLVAIGALGALGHFCIVCGFAFASASVLSPFLYAQVFFASVYSVLLVGDPLSLHLVLGASTLVASGVFIWWREHRSPGRRR